ncbi:hypothetical protein ABAZ39_13895 [Azospirillum argentinense]|uniref:Uncharacterized protein n=1 Tax=Azospirillum argentinense TaxID=2970906 RepID=A0A060DPI9_9PROT|nr:hypothetical protein ABAZ39_13895 [Azospirillum argentinense]EZQ09662.1 hypothetical protein ABAZ39_00720 [Azospirillum argentinense]
MDRQASPWLCASISTLGSPSRSPSRAVRQGRTNRSARRYWAITASWAFAPCQSIRPSSPSAAACAFSAGSRSPPPMWVQRQCSPAGRRASASSSRSKPFFSTARPTDSSRTGSAESDPSRAGRASGGSGKRLKSRPW